MQLQVNNVSKALGEKSVLRSVGLTLEGGQIACMLGASGCGKTTLLRCIAGFETVDSGTVLLDKDEVASVNAHVAPHDRGIGMVFQDHALFPHLTVAQNAAFGLHALSSNERTARTREVLALVGLNAHAERYAHQLSGGQQQRAALARALATKPRLLLLDEPFASLDRDLRYRLVQDVSRILKASGTTALWVTHDAREALQAADRVGVMREGEVIQWDTPEQLYRFPRTVEVAKALGDGALVNGTVTADGTVRTSFGAIRVSSEDPLDPGQSVQVLARSEQLTLSAVNALESVSDCDSNATVRSRWFQGAHTHFAVVLADGTELTVADTRAAALNQGDAARITWSVDKTVAFSV